jgi:site-specific DNA-methyltransferase (adenine-specific)
MNPALFSSVSDEWATPPALFHALDAEFHCDVDLCATAANTKCPQFLDPATNSLTVAWHTRGRVGWCNPPYTRGRARPFVEKALAERAAGFTTVLLLPARTDTRLFHELLWDPQTQHPRTGVSVRFLPGRITFVGAPAPAPFPSLVAVVHGRPHAET